MAFQRRPCDAAYAGLALVGTSCQCPFPPDATPIVGAKPTMQPTEALLEVRRRAAEAKWTGKDATPALWERPGCLKALLLNLGMPYGRDGRAPVRSYVPGRWTEYCRSLEFKHLDESNIGPASRRASISAEKGGASRGDVSRIRVLLCSLRATDRELAEDSAVHMRGGGMRESCIPCGRGSNLV